MWTCTSWVTSVRHYSRDYGTVYTTTKGRHEWGGVSVSSGTAGYKTGNVTLSVFDKGCNITVRERKTQSATFEGGGRVCSAKSNFIVAHSVSKSTGVHRKGSSVKQWTVHKS